MWESNRQADGKSFEIRWIWENWEIFTLSCGPTRNDVDQKSRAVSKAIQDIAIDGFVQDGGSILEVKL